ncbi:MAG: transposase [Oribacterium sp.]|nr:transposase [Oribacterium sp.]
MRDPEQAATELAKWIDDAKNSELKPMKELADKIENRHKENILNAIKCQANSAKSESTNTTIKGLIKLARGFRNLHNMIALIYLKCSDIVVPLCNRPQPSAEYLARKRARANELRRLREEQRRREFIA